jgi:hypothetical protein
MPQKRLVPSSEYALLSSAINKCIRLGVDFKGEPTMQPIVDRIQELSNQVNIAYYNGHSPVAEAKLNDIRKLVAFAKIFNKYFGC